MLCIVDNTRSLGWNGSRGCQVAVKIEFRRQKRCGFGLRRQLISLSGKFVIALADVRAVSELWCRLKRRFQKSRGDGSRAGCDVM